jgi:PAS domain S-box-containing protein
MRATLTRRIGFGLLLLGSVGLSLFGYFRLQEQIAAGRIVEHTATTIANLERLSAALAQAESSERGHILTGLDQFIENYSRATTQLWTSLERVRRLTADNATQQRRLSELEPLIRQRLARLELVMRTHSGGERPMEGIQAMAAAQRLIGDMEAEEQDLYLRRAARFDERARFSSIFLLGASLFFASIFLLLFGMMEREIVRRRRAEVQLSALNEELERQVEERTANAERSRRFMNAVVNNMQDAIVVNHNDRIAFANPAFARLLGAASPAELMDRPVWEVLPPGSQAQSEERIRQMKSSGLPAPLIETQLSRVDGTTVDVEVAAAPFRLDHDTAILAIFHDVTARKAQELQLRQAQKMEAVGQLTGGIAHDFNNLLGVVIGNLDLLLEAGALPEEGSELLQAAMDASLRGAELTQRLLSFSRKQALSPRVMDFNERLPGLAALLRRTLGENIRVQMVPGADLHAAVADPGQLENAVVNLAINARDAMPNGGVLTIETANVHLDEIYAAQHSEVEPGDYVMLAVTDTGTGMAPDTVERAFEPFFTTKEPGRGSGLGLSMVYGFTKQSGGHVKIYSEAGHGTTVKLYLPRALQDADRAAAPAPAAPIPLGREAVLVVEDNGQMRDTAVRLLRELGYSVSEADSALAALELMDGGLQPELLFTDIVMPGMSGYELAQAVRERRPGMKVLFTSGYAEASLRTGMAEAGPVLGKPYRKRDLATRVRQVLDGETLAASPLLKA